MENPIFVFCIDEDKNKYFKEISINISIIFYGKPIEQTNNEVDIEDEWTYMDYPSSIRSHEIRQEEINYFIENHKHQENSICKSYRFLIDPPFDANRLENMKYHLYRECNHLEGVYAYLSALLKSDENLFFLIINKFEELTKGFKEYDLRYIKYNELVKGIENHLWKIKENSLEKIEKLIFSLPSSGYIVKINFNISEGFNIYENKKNIIHRTCESYDTKFIHILGKYFTTENVNEKCCLGKCPLHYALRNHNIDANTIKLLIKMGADVNAMEYLSSPEVIRRSSCLGFYSHCNSELTPLMELLSSFSCNEEIVKILLDAGATVNNTKYCRMVTPLHIATRKGNLKLVKMLLNYGADIDYQDLNGETSLHIAVKSKFEAIVNLLIEYGANLEIKDKNVQTPLHYSVMRYHHNSSITNSLLNNGANIHAESRRRSIISDRYFSRNYSEDRNLKIILGKRALMKKNNDEFVDRGFEWLMNFINPQEKFKIEDEYRRLKNFIIQGTIYTLMEIMQAKDLNKYYRNEMLVDYFKSEKFQYDISQFKNYKGRLMVNIEKICNLNDAYNFLMDETGLPHLCVDIILEEITNIDLIKFKSILCD